MILIILINQYNIMIYYSIIKFGKNNNLGFPFSYLQVQTNYQFYNSYQILMEKNKEFVGMSRLYYINKERFELGDFFIADKFRGKYNCKKKYYQILLEKTIKIAKKINKNIKEITLSVDERNIKAIKLYEKNNFYQFDNKSKYKLQSKAINYIYMKLTNLNASKGYSSGRGKLK